MRVHDLTYCPGRHGNHKYYLNRVKIHVGEPVRDNPESCRRLVLAIVADTDLNLMEIYRLIRERRLVRMSGFGEVSK